MRSIAAVVVPWVVWGVLDTGVYMALSAASAETFPPSGAPVEASALALLVVLRVAYSVVAGWLAARLAAGRGRIVWMAIGLLMLTGIVAQAMQWLAYPVWYHMVFLATIIPAARLGAHRIPGTAQAV